VPPPRRPKLGQHFLASEGFRQRIVDALPLRSDDLVIEIGPGRGAMTELLAARAGRVVAIELDPVLAGRLKERLRGSERIEICQADILATDVSEICKRRGVEKCFVFGNLPYYITSPIIHHVLNYSGSMSSMAFLVQREVAERITANPGSRDYGYLSVLVQLHSEPRIALKVPPGAFSPPPKVQSALVEFKMRQKFPEWSASEQRLFLEFVKECFVQKRKSLLNNLQGTYSRVTTSEALRTLGLSSAVRAEQMPLEMLSRLFRQLSR